MLLVTAALDVCTVKSGFLFKVIMPNVLLMRLTNENDGNGRLFSGYELLISSQMLSVSNPGIVVKLIDETTIVLSLPAMSPSFWLYFDRLENVMRRVPNVLTDSVSNAQTTASEHMQGNPRIQRFNISISFDNGEELTNIPFSPTPTTNRFGPVLPHAAIPLPIPDEATTPISQTDLYIPYKIAVFEEDKNDAQFASRRRIAAQNPVMAQLANGMRGMRLMEQQFDSES